MTVIPHRRTHCERPSIRALIESAIPGAEDPHCCRPQMPLHPRLHRALEHYLPDRAAALADPNSRTALTPCPSDSAAIVTRQCAIRGTISGTIKGNPNDAKGNETMGWVYRDGGWKIAHLHYSHPRPRTAAQGA